ncbi:MAG: acetyl-CoA carboxylase, biotin carboxyl carrier protein [Candidatus Marinimicrobia bacterium]|nr:acetyl-CoA carboxylase, biotin carboxyl carrier protein [Candidatus Neomarinimicrobiota bacterium]|tara:strand:- start:16322 stop:16882 length:561 start_codon:yes stop_codon:yes gene_type:complete
MSLQKKIQKIIDVINNSNIEEIEISSFWGAQKIKLSKSVKNQQTPIIVKDSQSTAINTAEQTSIVSPVNKEDKKEQKVENQDGNVASESLEPSNQSIDKKQVLSDEDLEYQKAPLVGTFYASSKPGEPPFVSIGDTVTKGQTLCIIEAMKIFNEIESDFDGEIVEVLVDDESPVEFNQEIFSIKPN